MLNLDGVIEAWDEIVELLRRAFGIANDSLADLADAAFDAQEAVDKRAAERKRWGHPPKSMHMGYKQPVKKVKPNARSRIRKRGGQRRA